MAINPNVQHFFHDVAQTSTSALVPVGSPRQVGENEYVYVYNSAAALEPGQGAVIATASSGYTVTVSSTSGLDAFVGVAQVAIASGSYGYLLRRGHGVIEMGTAESAPVNGLVAPAANGNFCAVSGISQHVNRLPQARIKTAAASGASAGAYIFC